jgi:hypothetical protein
MTIVAIVLGVMGSTDKFFVAATFGLVFVVGVKRYGRLVVNR